MNAEFQQYRFARIEGHNITRARLEAQFKDGITDLDELEKAIAEQLTAEPTNCAPWRKSEIEQMGCREGIQHGGSGVFLVTSPRITTCKPEQFRLGDPLPPLKLSAY